MLWLNHQYSIKQEEKMKAKSLNGLFGKSIGYTLVINICLHLFFYLNSSEIAFWIISMAKIVSAIIIGTILRVQNIILLEQNEVERKMMILKIIIGIILCSCMFETMLFKKYYMYLAGSIYETIGLSRFFNVFDYMSCVLCLFIVFQKIEIRKLWKKKIKKVID